MEIRIVVDTNVVYAGLYSSFGASYQVLCAISENEIHPALSVSLLFEYEEVLKRNSRKLGLSFRDIDVFLDNMCRMGSFQKIHYLWRPFLPDPKDDHVLELAVASEVRKIVTFNARDFRGSEKFNIEIISPKRLLEEIQWER